MHVTFGGIHEGNLAELRLLNDTTFPVRYNDRFYQEVLTTLPEFTKYAYVHGQVVGAICCRMEEEEVEEEGEEDGRADEQVVQISPLPTLQQEQQQEGQQEQQQGGSTSTPPSEEGANGHVFLPPKRIKRRRKLYIMTLGVQAAYRGQGIGSQLLTSVLDAATRPPHCTNSSSSSSGSTSPDLEEIYLHVQTSNADAIHFYSKFGFVTREMIRNYYKRIEPPDCYILSRTLEGGGGGGGGGGVEGEEARKGKWKAPPAPPATAAASGLAELATAAAAAGGGAARVAAATR
jgi:ribosomal protein S18 acetylase RimI-like enzyme